MRTKLSSGVVPTLAVMVLVLIDPPTEDERAEAATLDERDHGAPNFGEVWWS